MNPKTSIEVRKTLYVNTRLEFDQIFFFSAFKQLNVSGVMTDCPTLLSEWLKTNAIDANDASEKRLFNKDK